MPDYRAAPAPTISSRTLLSQVTLADVRPVKLPKFLAGDWKGRLRTIQLDVTDMAAVTAVFKGHAAVMSAIPYYYNGPMAKLLSSVAATSPTWAATPTSSWSRRSSTNRRWRKEFRSSLTAAWPRGWSTYLRQKVSGGWTGRRR